MVSATLLKEAAAQLARHAPFSGMSAEDLDFAAAHAKIVYFAPGQCLIEPGHSPLPGCFVVREGRVRAAPPGKDTVEALAASDLEAGDIFPVGSLLSGRATLLRYTAEDDVFCWLLPADRFDELIRRSAVFLDFCKRRIAALAELSLQSVQAAYATQAAQWRLMSQPLSSMVSRPPVTCAPDDSLRSVFELMDRQRVGSIMVLPESGGVPIGILTLQDLIGRIVLPGLSLDEPVSRVMSSPVQSLPAGASVSDAVMLMAEQRIRHVPVVEDQRLLGIVTERDLFALQRRSHRQISGAIDSAESAEHLITAATDIRQWSRALVAQGMSARYVTRLVSQLNDMLTCRLVELLAEASRVDLRSFCWLTFGSEGREEQTIATDQDNGMVFDDTVDESTAARLRAFGGEVNRWLDRCGFPLCRGNIMAGNPDCAMTLDAWRARFDRWLANGSPQDLLNASIFFDLRPLAGRLELGEKLRDHICATVPGNRRFLKLLSDNALRNVPPPSLLPGVLGALIPDTPAIDLKLSGSMPLVDGARLLALAAGIAATGTAERFEALVRRGTLRDEDARSWVDAFEYLQGLRLRVQLDRIDDASAAPPNLLRLSDISELDRRILKESFRQVRKLQQRLSLDYP